MKYCKKCGMLLEDTCNTCIRCGLDVTRAENVSLYPPDVMKTIDAQKDEQKKRAKIIILIVVLFSLLAILVAVAAVTIEKGGFELGTASPPSQTEKAAEIVDNTEEVVEEAVEEAPVDTEETASPIQEEKQEEAETRAFRDEKGEYYRFTSEKDEVNNVIFNAVYPESFETADFQLDYDTCSAKLPISFQFVATGEDGGVSFLYYSPKHYWYKKSETGKTRSNERDITNRMSYLEFTDGQAYIESILQQSYKGAKIELINKTPVSETSLEAAKELSELRSKALFGKIGDYAKLGEDTTYANMDAVYSVDVYEYEITTSDKQVVFDEFYVPCIANNLYYATDASNDRGIVTEWYCLGVIGFEAGNEDIRDDYKDDFEVFMSNCIPTETFMYINQLYSDDIQEAVSASRAMEAMTEGMLADYTNKAKSGIKLNDTNAAIIKVLRAATDKSFSTEDITVYTKADKKVAFVSEEEGKLYLSSDEQDYPGDKYTELKLIQEGTAGNTDNSATDNSAKDDATDTAADSDAGAIRKNAAGIE